LNAPPSRGWGDKPIFNVPSAIGGIVDRTVRAQRGEGARPLAKLRQAMRKRPLMGQLGSYLGTGTRPKRNIGDPYSRVSVNARAILGNFPSVLGVKGPQRTVHGLRKEKSPIQIADTSYPERGDSIRMSVVHT